MSELLTMQDLANGHLDVKALGEAANGDENTIVTTRTGNTYPSAERAINIMFKNGGLPAEPFETKAQMTSEGASLPDGQLAMVHNDTANNGLYVKTAGAWVKSKYNFDEVLDQKIIPAIVNSDDFLNISDLSSNYELSLTDAIALVPYHLRKKNLSISFFNSKNWREKYQFKGGDSDSFSDIRFWLKATDVDLSRDNLFDVRTMYYEGFSPSLLSEPSGFVYGEDKACVIFPIMDTTKDDGSHIGLSIRNLKTNHEVDIVPDYFRYFFLDDNLKVLSSGQSSVLLGLNLTSFPSGSRYFCMAVDSREYDIDWFLDTLYYQNPYKDMRFSEIDVIASEIDNATNPIVNLVIDGNGDTAYSLEKDIFKHPLQTISFSKKSEPLCNLFEDFYFVNRYNNDHIGTYGRVRRVYVEHINRHGGGLIIRIAIEDKDNEGEFYAANALPYEYEGATYLDSKKAKHSLAAPDGLKVYFTCKPYLFTAVSNQTLSEELGEEYGAIKEEWLVNQLNKGYTPLEFRMDTFDISKPTVSSNYENRPPTAKLADNLMLNGGKYYRLTGSSTDNVHEHSALTCEVVVPETGYYTLSAFYKLNIDSANGQPETKLMQNRSAYGNYGTNGMHVHPDVVCIPDGFLGYKYWMINSYYPFGSPPVEDAEIFVSNDGIDWDRVPHPQEAEESSVPFKLPESYWDVSGDRKRLFMPIPKVGASMQFATDTLTSEMSITKYLAHDPAISYQDGWLNFYCTYNFGLDGSNLIHRYTVCYRTNDFTTWEVVREDGSSFAYNEVSAQDIFSKTNEVRNHLHYHKYTGSYVTKQFVKVSDNDWRCYTITNQSLVYFEGTSPYNFDWDNMTSCSFNSSLINMLWHISVEVIDGKYYLMYGGNLAESTDGVVFDVLPYPVLEIGLSAETYKPYFVVGHDNKLKVGASIGVRTTTVEPFMGYDRHSVNMFSRDRYIPQTVCTEYASIDDLKKHGNGLFNDAFVDVTVTVHNNLRESFSIINFSKIKNSQTLGRVYLTKGDYVRGLVYLNAVKEGKVDFYGLIFDKRSSVGSN